MCSEVQLPAGFAAVSGGQTDRRSSGEGLLSKTRTVLVKINLPDVSSPRRTKNSRAGSKPKFVSLLLPQAGGSLL